VLSVVDGGVASVTSLPGSTLPISGQLIAVHYGMLAWLSVWG